MSKKLIANFHEFYGKDAIVEVEEGEETKEEKKSDNKKDFSIYEEL